VLEASIFISPEQQPNGQLKISSSRYNLKFRGFTVTQDRITQWPDGHSDNHRWMADLEYVVGPDVYRNMENFSNKRHGNQWSPLYSSTDNWGKGRPALQRVIARLIWDDCGATKLVIRDGTQTYEIQLCSAGLMDGGHQRFTGKLDVAKAGVA
jgi:hypothetical protein